MKARKRPSISYLRILGGTGLVVGFLYLGRPILVPLSLAVLFTFILTPLVKAVQTSGLGRVPSVLLVVFISLLVAALIGWGVGAQLDKLATELPTHTEEVRERIANFREAGSGRLSRLFRMYHDVGESNAVKTSSAASVAPPIVVQSSSSPATIESVSTVAGLILEPIATGLLVMILVGFMLIRREDLRNRMIGLLGHGRLAGTTRVTVEAAERLSRFLLAQLSLNAAFGLVFGLLLWTIGVPYWLLWGFVMALLRFVPYVGTWIAAIGPVLLSFAIFPDWFHPLIVLGVFAAMEVITSNIIEPIVLGHSTGVSPVALLVAAAFWLWVWGPVGLVLSTPLTACLVVLGQHVPRFRFLATLLDDQPALEPHVSYYQRLLAGDRDEAAQLVAEYGQKSETVELFDKVLLPAILRTRRDRKYAGLTNQDETFIFDATQQVLGQLARKASETAEENNAAINAGGAKSAVTASDAHIKSNPASTLSTAAIPVTTGSSEMPVIFAYPAHHRAEELSLQMLALELEPLGCRVEIASTRTLPVEIESRLSVEQPAVVFIAIVPPGGLVQARYLCKRLRKISPELTIVVGYWGRVRNFDQLLVQLRSSGANYVTTSLAQSRVQIRELLAELPSLSSDNSIPDAQAAKAVTANG
jgi:predicted PurR-regulated permease PerM